MKRSKSINYKEQFLELYNQRLNDKQISDILKISNASVQRLRTSLNLPANIKKIVVDEQKFTELYNLGTKYNELKIIFGVNENLLRDLARKLGLKPRRGSYTYDDLVRLTNEGLHDTEIARRLGITKSAIGYAKEFYNLDSNKYIFSEEHKSKIVPPYLGKHIPNDVKQKLSLALGGDKNPNWKGGRTQLKERIRIMYQYTDWRLTCFKRDNFTCQWCGDSKGGNLCVDHIKPLALIIQENDIKTTEDASKCLELWNTNNGRTLCENCHKKTPTWGGGTIKMLRDLKQETN